MQATSPTVHPTSAGWLTTASLMMILVFAAITIAAIVYGMRLASRRRAARLTEEQRVEAETTPEPAEPKLAAPPPVERAPEPKPEPEPEPDRIEPAPAAVAAVADDPAPAAPDLLDEPVAAAAPFDASPAAEADATAAAPVDVGADDRPLTILKGLGPKVAARLGELGLTTVGDLAALDDARAEAIDARLGPFTGRMARDRWLEQARLLAAGDERGFEAAFGRL